MPSMYEIYQKYAAQYDELVDAEDCQRNLNRCLLMEIDWAGRSVLEAGCGTGRVTQIYAPLAVKITCLDRSAHMLEAAERRLRAYAAKITYRVAENTDLPILAEPHDIFIEGWSFGHAVVDSGEPVEKITRLLLENARRSLCPGAPLVIIETMGTATLGPTPPLDRLAQFYACLEERHGFIRHVVETDYSFPSLGEAARIMGFFFGVEMGKQVQERGQVVIPEWTGVWIGKEGFGDHLIVM